MGKKLSFSKQDKIWKEISKEKRSKYNPKYNKNKSEVDMEEDEIIIPTDYKNKDPKDIPLDRSIKFIKRGFGGDIDIYFVDDITDEEIAAIGEKVKREMNLV